VLPARLAHYTRPVAPEFIARLVAAPPRTMEALNTAWYGTFTPAPSRYNFTRYHFLNFNSLFVRGTFEIRAFNGTLHAGKVKAYVQLSLALAATAHAARTVRARPRGFAPATARYDMRVLANRLGMVGDEFKTARHHLTHHLGGSAAWKHTRPALRAAAAEASNEPTGAAVAA
jgi:hypothetical protein